MEEEQNIETWSLVTEREYGETRVAVYQYGVA